MGNRKKIRTRGKLQLSKYFQEFNEGDKVSVVKEPAIPSIFPKRLYGKTGIIEKKRGRAYEIKIREQKNEKIHLIRPIHLKKIKESFKEND